MSYCLTHRQDKGLHLGRPIRYALRTWSWSKSLGCMLSAHDHWFFFSRSFFLDMSSISSYDGGCGATAVFVVYLVKSAQNETKIIPKIKKTRKRATNRSPAPHTSFDNRPVRLMLCQWHRFAFAVKDHYSRYFKQEQRPWQIWKHGRTDVVDRQHRLTFLAGRPSLTIQFVANEKLAGKKLTRTIVVLTCNYLKMIFCLSNRNVHRRCTYVFLCGHVCAYI